MSNFVYFSRIAAKVLLAARLDKLKEKYPKIISELDELSRSDPSGSKQKYLEWGARQLDSGSSLNDLLPSLRIFDKFPSKFKSKDINQYKTLKDLESEIKEKNLSEGTKSKRLERTEAKTSGATKLYEDDEQILLRIEDKRACVEYGKGTKWCITMENASYYEEYSSNNVVFYYLIQKTQDPKDPESKIAYAVQRDMDNKIIKVEAFDQEDNKTYSDQSKIMDIIEKDAPTVKEGAIVRMKNGTLPEDQFMAEWDKIYDSSSADIEGMMDMVDSKYLPLLMHDPDNITRQAIAKRINSKYLPEMMSDEDGFVRWLVADRIDGEYLPKMMGDSDRRVRGEVVNRIGQSYLIEMMNDADEYVRRAVANRIDPSRLSQMMDDEKQSVREAIVKRIEPKYLPHMIKDEIPLIRSLAAARIEDPEALEKAIKNEKEDWVRRNMKGRLDKLALTRWD